MTFTATEVGFENGLGGASNAEGCAERHYILFGMQEDRQHPKNSGVYFEFDDQINGAVNSVNRIRLSVCEAEFTMEDGKTITVKSELSNKWDEFVAGIRSTFAAQTITIE